MKYFVLLIGLLIAAAVPAQVVPVSPPGTAVSVLGSASSASVPTANPAGYLYTYDPRVYGAVCNGSTDDSGAWNTLISAVRSATVLGPSGTTRTAHIIGDCAYSAIATSLNFTNFLSASKAGGVVFDFAGTTFICSLASTSVNGKACIDVLSSRFLSFNNLSVYGNCTTNEPTIGVQVGRHSGIAADDNSFYEMNLSGCFTQSDFYNNASENLTLVNPSMTNFDTSGSAYTLIQDGFDHWIVGSLYAPGCTYSGCSGLTPDTYESFNQTVMIGGQILTGTGGAGTPFWLGGGHDHRYFGVYMNTCTNVGAVLFQESGQSLIATTVTAASASIAATNTFASGNAVVFTGSMGSVTGLTPGTIYYVSATGLSGTAFQVSATSGGTVITPGGSSTATPNVSLATATNAIRMANMLFDIHFESVAASCASGSYGNTNGNYQYDWSLQTTSGLGIVPTPTLTNITWLNNADNASTAWFSLGANVSTAVINNLTANIDINNNGAANVDNVANYSFNNSLGPFGPQNPTGVGNVSYGFEALNSVTSGSNNVAIGNKTLNSVAVSSSATAVGVSALGSTTASNDGFGANTGQFISSGNSNLALGRGSMTGVTGTRTTGSNNTGAGINSLNKCQGACGSNTAVGYSACGSTLTTGSTNICVGASTDTVASTTSNEVNIGGAVMGYSVTPSVTSGAGTGGSISGGGTFLFWLTEGSTGTPSATLVLAMPTAPTDWACDALDRTSTTITARQTGAASTTAATITFSSAPANSDRIQIKCLMN